MPFISLSAAVSISGLSKRTLWRRIADRSLRTKDGADPREVTQVELDDVLLLSPLHLEPDDHQLILDADAGDPESQCDLALLFLAQNRPAEAVGWLERSASRLYPEALHQLGRCYIAGNGVAADEQVGTMWIERAAARGHVIAESLVRYLNDASRPPTLPDELEAALDAIERKIVMNALEEATHPR